MFLNMRQAIKIGTSSSVAPIAKYLMCHAFATTIRCRVQQRTRTPDKSTCRLCQVFMCVLEISLIMGATENWRQMNFNVFDKQSRTITLQCITMTMYKFLHTYIFLFCLNMSAALRQYFQINSAWPDIDLHQIVQDMYQPYFVAIWHGC